MADGPKPRSRAPHYLRFRAPARHAYFMVPALAEVSEPRRDRREARDDTRSPSKRVSFAPKAPSKRGRSPVRGDTSPLVKRPRHGMRGPSPTKKRRLATMELSNWTFELRRSGKAKCCCRAVPQTVPVDRQMPRAVDVVQLPYLSKSQEFLVMHRRDIQRCVYELSPDTMADWTAYEEFRDYLLKGRNKFPRAGRALEMKAQGYDIFIMPPGEGARLVGYQGGQMIAVLRARV